VLITGGNSGIGKASATALAARGARVVITSRDRSRGQRAMLEIRQKSGSMSVGVMDLDLAALESVRSFADNFLARAPRLDVLVLNAGIYAAQRRLTDDGFELMFQVNHLAHFLLTRMLLPRLLQSAPSRIVVVASSSHRQAGPLNFDDLQAEHTFAGLKTYAQTKLCNVLFARELARRLDGTGVTANALHPGTVRTGWGMEGDSSGLLRLGLTVARPFFTSPQRAARTTVHLAWSRQAEGITGGYWWRSRPGRPGRNVTDEAARRLWDVSEELLGLEPLRLRGQRDDPDVR
jgi:NAD(P)-dependent dehydrogenase (short-subunit alcohol dehydrogenase family)